MILLGFASDKKAHRSHATYLWTESIRADEVSGALPKHSGFQRALPLKPQFSHSIFAVPAVDNFFRFIVLRPCQGLKTS